MGVVTALVIYGGAQLVVAERLDDAQSLHKLDIAGQQTVVVSLSEIMTRGGVDTVTATVIRDCEPRERDRFDLLLGKLGTSMPASELSELSRLFDRCASYYARQKAVMAARFEREVEVYELLTSRLTTLVPSEDVSGYHVTTWKEIARIEREQAMLFDKLVRLQGEIIEALMAGKGIGAPEVDTLLNAVRETQEMQAYNVVTLASLRSSLPLAI
jgi:hypothetical protein